ncbi:MAG TPA: fumarylacetoacetate hydrolase family protein, partial [Verrucomicrobiae bacterium]|nr:fumarylacetoacetate hydrolase family protein [Verrucomicrobiae bacterium]
EHARELGNETPEAPVLFMKPATAVVGDGGTVVIPSWSKECHHEVELALLVGSGGSRIPAASAFEHIAGYAVAIDFTLRDVQAKLKEKGLPWEVAKGFDTSCPLSQFLPAADVPDPHGLTLRLSVNGEVRQQGSTSLMVHRITRIISHISSIFTLEPGDVILTGTPSGVGPVQPGDSVEAAVAGLCSLTVTVLAALPK